MAVFEVVIFNKDVREKVEAGEHHRRFADKWADFQYIEIGAESEEQARAQVEVMYPSSQGFKIDNIQEIGGRF